MYCITAEFSSKSIVLTKDTFDLRINIRNYVIVATQVRSRMATKYGCSNGSFHRVLYSPAVQKVRVRFPAETQHSQMLYVKGCRWLWSSLYIVVTPTWCTILTQQHAFGRISMRTSHATKFSHDPPSWLGGGGGAVATQVRSRMATKYDRSNGSFHRVLACSAGGPGFDSPLRSNILRCSM